MSVLEQATGLPPTAWEGHEGCWLATLELIGTERRIGDLIPCALPGCNGEKHADVWRDDHGRYVYTCGKRRRLGETPNTLVLGQLYGFVRLGRPPSSVELARCKSLLLLKIGFRKPTVELPPVPPELTEFDRKVLAVVSEWLDSTPYPAALAHHFVAELLGDHHERGSRERKRLVAAISRSRRKLVEYDLLRKSGETYRAGKWGDQPLFVLGEGRPRRLELVEQ